MTSSINTLPTPTSSTLTQTAITRAILVVHDDEPDGGLQLHRVLHPLVDRPVIQHAVESLVRQGITDIDVLLAVDPEQIEEFLGDGTRWGINLRYFLTFDPTRPFEPLKHVAFQPHDRVAIMRADLFYPGSLQLLTKDGTRIPAAYTRVLGDSTDWAGLAVITPDHIEKLSSASSFSVFRDKLLAACEISGRQVGVPEEIDASTYENLLKSQRKALKGQFTDLTRIRRGSDGITLGRNVSIHSAAVIRPPVYIGDHTQIGAGAEIGPNVVISNECVIDDETTIRNSLILPKTSVGEGLELCDLVADGKRMVNVRLGATLNVPDDFLIGDLDEQTILPTTGRLIFRILSLFLLLASLPILALVWLVRLPLKSDRRQRVVLRLPVYPGQERKTFAITTHTSEDSQVKVKTSIRSALWRHLLLDFIPNLFYVVKGELSIVGVTPQSIQEIEALPTEWNQLTLHSRAGLITESLVQFGPHASSFERQLADAHYAVKASFRHDIKLISRYIIRLIRG
jgi:hypothetical protein